jgi:hypothetical protein
MKKFKALNKCSGEAEHARVSLGASWSAVAERSGDTAFGRTKNFRVENNFSAVESGVALRFPPQSKTSQAGAAVVSDFNPFKN